MLLAYADESYTRERYYIAAVVVDGAMVGKLSRALDQVVEETADDHGGVHTRAELHAHDLVGGSGDWFRLAPKIRVRIGVYQRALDALVDHDTKIIYRGVDIPALDARYPGGHDHPHSIALNFLIEDLDAYAAREGEYALLIADEVGDQNQYRRDLWSYQQSGTWGWKSRQITRVVDTIHFAPSHASRLVQAADLAVFLHRRIRTHQETDQRAQRAWEKLYDTVRPLVITDKTWIPERRR